jgi:WD40 repeat protein
MTDSTKCCCLLALAGTSFLGALAAPKQCFAQPAVTYRSLPVAAPRPSRIQSEPIMLRESGAIALSTVFSRNGTSVVTVDGKGAVARWDLAHPGERQELVALDRELACALLGDDARWLAFAEQDGSVSLLELETKKYRLKAGPQSARTVALAVSDDGTRLAGVSDAGDIRLWDVERGKLFRTLATRPGAVQTAAFSHDGKQLALGSFTNEVRVFDLASPRDVKLVQVGPSRVTAVAFSRDNQGLVIATADGAVRVHGLADGDPVSLGTHAFAVWRLAFDPSGERLAAASWDGMIRVWATASRELLQSQKSHEQSISAMTFGPDGDLVSASLDGRLYHWRQAPAGRGATAMIAGRADSVWVAVYSPDGRTLFVGGREKRFELWDPATHKLLVSRQGHPTTRCAVFSPDGKTLATGGDDGLVALWDARTGERKAEFRRHPGAVSAVVFMAKGETFVSACDGGLVKLWDLQTGNEKASWREHQRQIYCANISPDDKWLLTGGGDWTSDAPGELIVWELATGRVRAKLEGHRLAVWTIAFTPDGRRFATSCSSGTVKLWDLETLDELQTLQHPTWTRALAFSPDGGTLAVGLGDSSIRLWNTSDWQQTASLEGHESFAFHLQFAPDGGTLATSGNDGTVRFWEIGRKVTPERP